MECVVAQASSLFPSWFLSVYPSAGEAGGGITNPNRQPSAYVARGCARDPLRSSVEAAGRAKGSLRRYCAANGLNRLGTLTYAGAGCHDPRVVRSDVADFFRTLRSATGGKAFAYAWVPEWHKTDHGLHLHFGLGQYIPQRMIRDTWGRGHVSIKLLGDLPVGTGRLGEARRVGGYLSKYVSKAFAEPGGRVMGLHRYDVAQGFQPEKITVEARTSGDVLALASEMFGGPPARRWLSWETPQWDRPPAIWAQWGR